MRSEDSGWTIETLKQHFEQRLLDIDKAVQTALTAADKAVQTALISAEKAVEKALIASQAVNTTSEINAEKWRANANEWRGAMVDREARFISRDEALSKFESLSVAIVALKESQDKYAGERRGVISAQAMISWVIALVVAFITISSVVIGIAFWLKP